MITKSTVALLILLCAVPNRSTAAPNYPLEGLLPRAQTVFIGRLTMVKDNEVTIEVNRILRASPGFESTSFRFGYYPGDQLPSGGTTVLVLSQGDNHFGQPGNKVTLGQLIKGQAGYCGWIMLPIVKRDDQEIVDMIFSIKLKAGWGKVTLAQAEQLVRETVYKADLHGTN